MLRIYYVKYVGVCFVAEFFCDSYAFAYDVAARHNKDLEVETISITEL